MLPHPYAFRTLVALHTLARFYRASETLHDIHRAINAGEHNLALVLTVDQ